MALEPLLSLVDTPYPDALFNKPLDHKGSLVRFTPEAVEHEYQQDIELALFGLFLDELQLVPVIGADLVTRHTSLLFFSYDGPAHFSGKLPAGFALYRDVRLIHVVMVYLLGCGNTI